MRQTTKDARNENRSWGGEKQVIGGSRWASNLKIDCPNDGTAPELLAQRDPGEQMSLAECQIWNPSFEICSCSIVSGIVEEWD